MAIQILTDITSLIKQQIDAQETLSEYLSKVEAILYATSAERLLECELFILQNYLWALCDMTIEAKKLNEQALHALLRGSMDLGYR